MKLKPNVGRIVAKRVQLQGKTPGGILLTKTDSDKVGYAKIESVGPKRKDDPELPFRAGDLVAFFDHMPTQIGHTSQSYLLLEFSDIFAVVE